MQIRRPPKGPRRRSRPLLSAKEQRDPLLRSLAEMEPKTPQDFTRAIRILLNIGKPNLAKPYLERLIELNPSPRDSDQLIDEFGTSLFIDMSQSPELGSFARPFVEQLLSAADAFRSDPAQLAEMIGALRSPDRHLRQTALRQLQRAHQAAAVAMIAVMADPECASEHRAIAAALVQMGGDAVGPAQGALETSDPALKAQMMLLAARLGNQQATNLMGAQRRRSAPTPPRPRRPATPLHCSPARRSIWPMAGA